MTKYENVNQIANKSESRSLIPVVMMWKRVYVWQMLNKLRPVNRILIIISINDHNYFVDVMTIMIIHTPNKLRPIKRKEIY